MELEFDIEDLLRKNKIESDRIEFKKGWNPDDIYRSICAFANDFDNIGGGYIVIGVEEKDGVAVRPVSGIPLDTIDKIQKEMLGFNRKIQPAYYAKLIPQEVDGQNIMVVWVPTGALRPYKITEHVTSKNDNNYKYFIRYGTSSIAASSEQEKELLAMTAHEPFDVQGNPKASIDDISPLLLEAHLKETGSKLANQISTLGVREVLDQMELLDGPPERQFVKNVALMMFCDHADKFFPYMQVEIVRFPNGSIKDPKNFIEAPPITGTVPQIIRRTMEKLQDIAISEYVQKVPDRMEANRFISYPYDVLEEAVVNAFYHRDYMCYEPVEIEIEPDCIRITSRPGIDRSISLSTIEKGERFKSKYYRNRRLGEFLKELDLTEGRSTGIPTIQDGLLKNGSPRATFETDVDRQVLWVTIPIQPDYYKGVRNDNDMKPTYSENGNKDSGLLQNETRLKQVLKQVLKQADYDKVIPLLDPLEEKQQLSIQEVMALTGKARTTAWRYMKMLEEANVVVSEGETNNTVYRLKI